MSELEDLRKYVQELEKQLHEENLRLKERITRLLEHVNIFQKKERDAQMKILKLEQENKELKQYMERHNIQ